MELPEFGYRIGGRFTAVRQAQTQEHAADMEKLLRRCLAEKHEQNWIEVFAIDEERYTERQKRAPLAKAIELGKVFYSANKASRHLGYLHNEVNIRRHAAREKGQDEWTVCGVSFKKFHDN